MKKTLKLDLYPWLTLGLGMLAAMCMFLLCKTGVDDRGLFVPGHWASIALWCLTAIMAVVLAVSARDMKGRTKYSRMFPPSRMAAVGTLAAGLGILATAMDSLTAGEPIRIMSGVLKILAALILVYLAWCRWENRRGSFLAWGVVTLYLMARLMLEYQSWSGQPELLEYFFPLVSAVCLTLAFYQRTAFAVNMGSRRMYLVFTQAGAFCALAALAGDFSPFHAGMALWALTDLCSQKPLRPKGKYASKPQENPS